MPTLPPVPTFLLALTILTATPLIVLVITPPNPNPTSSALTTTEGPPPSSPPSKPNPQPESQPQPPTRTKDSISLFASPVFLSLCRVVIIVLGLYHASLTLSFPTPPQAICRTPENLSKALFTWSRTTSLCLGAILLAAPLRLLAFRQLGPNFTFALHPPGKLVTTGLYAYVQHPSYTANVIVILAAAWLFGHFGGGLFGCWLPGWLWPVWRMVGALAAGAGAMATWLRVEDEERMLRGAFGREWEAWHQRTKRFIPWVF